MKTIDQRIEEMRARLVELGESPSESMRESVRDVQAAVCAAFNLPHRLLVTERRTARSCSARWAAFQICREYLNLTLVEIGNANKKDHGTVVHGLKKFQTKFKYDSDFRKGYERALLALGYIEKEAQP